MAFQLVVQFATGRDDDFGFLVEFEERLIAAMGRSADVDGHDFGKDDMNIFIITKDPEASFQRVTKVAEEMNSGRTMKIAYRNLEAEEYTSLWPEDLRDFGVS